MKKKNKAFSVFISVVLAVSAMSMSSFALTDALTDHADLSNGSHIYTGGEWEYTRTVFMEGGALIGYICYGFDKIGIYEDYCWTKSDISGGNSRAGVKRNGLDSLYNYASYQNPGTWSKCEVMHHTNYTSIYFRIQFSTNFLQISLGPEYPSWNK